MNDLISIIIPVFNRDHLIKDTLDSILVQTFENWECIIVDDGSTDWTREIVTKYCCRDCRFKLYERPVQIIKGPSACRNLGINVANGEFIQFFDSDDIMHPDHLLLKIQNIKDNDFITCKVQIFVGKFDDNVFEDEGLNNFLKPKNPLKSFLLEQFPMCSSAPMWKVTYLKKHLPLREDLHILEDRELHSRVFKDKPKFDYIDKPLIYYRRDLKSSTNDFFDDVGTGIQSFLSALEAILQVDQSKEVRIHILKKVFIFFRKALDQRNLKAAKLCLDFTDKNRLWCTAKLKKRRIKILFAFSIFRVIQMGDTRFKNLVKV